MKMFKNLMLLLVLLGMITPVMEAMVPDADAQGKKRKRESDGDDPDSKRPKMMGLDRQDKPMNQAEAQICNFEFATKENIEKIHKELTSIEEKIKTGKGSFYGRYQFVDLSERTYPALYALLSPMLDGFCRKLNIKQPDEIMFSLKQGASAVIKSHKSQYKTTELNIGISITKLCIDGTAEGYKAFRFMIAHELSHLTQTEENQRYQTLAFSAQLFTSLEFVKLSQKLEKDADLKAAKIIDNFAVADAEELFRKLSNERTLLGLPEALDDDMLSTHPSRKARIAYLNNYVKGSWCTIL